MKTIDDTFAPLQRPSADRLLRRTTYGGGPGTGLDVRMYLDRQTLRLLLSAAEGSLSGRVELLEVGLRVDVYESPAGHRYEVWSFVSRPPTAEKTGFEP